MPHLTRTLTAAGESHIAAIGRIHLQAQLTVDGGVTIAVWAGPNRGNAATFTYADREMARRRYDQIRQLARAGLSPEQIDAHVNGGGNAAVEQVRQILTEASEHIAADPAPGAGALTAVICDEQARLETVAEAAWLDELARRHPAHPAHGRCAADNVDEQEPVDEPAPQVRTLAEMRARFVATHPQPTEAPRRRRTRRVSPSVAYDKSRTRTQGVPR